MTAKLAKKKIKTHIAKAGWLFYEGKRHAPPSDKTADVTDCLFGGLIVAASKPADFDELGVLLNQIGTAETCKHPTGYWVRDLK